MKVAVYNGTGNLSDAVQARLDELWDELNGSGCETAFYRGDSQDLADCDFILSVGGDGTFLSASALSVRNDIPIVGVNTGRVGFLSENRPEDVARALLEGDYEIEERAVLKASIEGVATAGAEKFWPYAFNEFTVHRSGAAMLGIDVDIDGISLPTYWADGLIISTCSGSTAYSLSAGGPIVLPGSKVLILTPIAPHNLNIRPLIVPDTVNLSFRVHSRDTKVVFTADTRSLEINDGTLIRMGVAQFSLKRVRLGSSNFINALTEKLFWGEDVRNIK